MRLKISQTFESQSFDHIFKGEKAEPCMPQKIPKEKLRDLYERSVNSQLAPEQCAIWLPEVCAMALELLDEAEARERAMALIERVEQFKRNRRG